RLLFDFTGGSGKHWRWMPPTIPEFAGPIELARLLVSYRNKLAEIKEEIGRELEEIGDISSDVLESLLKFAHKASFYTDEGGPVVARLLVPERSQDDQQTDQPILSVFRDILRKERANRDSRRNVLRFDPPLPLIDPKVLARIAPTLK